MCFRSLNGYALLLEPKVIAHRRSLLHGIVLDAKKQGFVCAAAKEHFFHADGNVL